MKAIHFITISSAHALVFTIMLKFLFVFDYITWNPIRWTDKWQVFSAAHPFVKWILTFLVIFLVINIMMGLFLLIKKMPAVATSIVVGLAIWILLEWSIYQDFSHISWKSIPIVASILIISRALAETIVYYDQEVYEDKRK
ncbi:hypothetical protein [Paenisporosarcina sp.]|uniref:hypothetical protein n=1 Tax=Paenisporosarcina sp. TaxID=1932001 RepID=UPI003C786ADB